MSTPGNPLRNLGAATLESGSSPEPLLDDLARVAELLRESAQRGPASSLTAVFRLVPNLNKINWREMVSSGKCPGWFALDLLPDSESRPLPDVPGTPLLRRQDPATGMLEAVPFMEQMAVEMAHMQRARMPFTLMLFEMDVSGLDERPAASALRVLSSRLWETAKGRDVLGMFRSNLLALALPGSGPFQALALAESTVEDTCGRLAAIGTQACTVHAGVAALDNGADPAQGVAELLENARQALLQSSNAPDATVRDRVRLFRAAQAPVERETLVMANEKHFLFFGGA